MEGVIAIASLPIILLNVAGGIVGGIWLLATGKWALVVGAFISTLVATWILGLLLMPTLVFTKPLAWAFERKKYILASLLAALSSLWTYALILVYEVGSFNFVLSNYEGGSVLPYLLLAYAIATGPWAYMAKGESQSGDAGIGTTLPVFSACVAAIVMMISVMIRDVSHMSTLVVTGLIPLAIAWILQLVITFVTFRQNARLGEILDVVEGAK